MSAHHAHTLPQGAQWRDGRARFRIWAPAQRALQLELEGRRPQRMQARPDGWFEAEADCTAGTGYRYRLDEGTAIADPASRAQRGGVHGWSLVVDPRAFEWKHALPTRPWPETVLYEVHAGACGGFDGLRARLPVLAALGINAIELMPIAEFAGTRGWGYDGVLPYAVKAEYGGPEALKRLVDEAHRLGLAMFLDVVYNHFGPDGNVLPQLAPAFFDADRQTPWGAAIDFMQPAVSEFFLHNALYWLEEYQFDGLRFDAVHAIVDRDWLRALPARIRGALPAGRHAHLVLENEHNDAELIDRGFDAQWHDDAHNALHVLLTGENEGYYAHFAGEPAKQLARCLGGGFARGDLSVTLAPANLVLFLQNHDQVGNRALGERLGALADPEALAAAATVQLLCPQVPLLFMGEDWGSTRPFLFFTDFHGELAEAVREGRRKEFARFSAFADPATRARIPDPNSADTFERSRPDFETADESRRRPYAHLLRLRAERLAPHLAGARALASEALGPSAVRTEWRLGNGARLCLLANFGTRDQAASAPDLRLLHESAPGAADALHAGQLPPRRALAFLGGD